VVAGAVAGTVGDGEETGDMDILMHGTLLFMILSGDLAMAGVEAGTVGDGEVDLVGGMTHGVPGAVAGVEATGMDITMAFTMDTMPAEVELPDM
jgi:hypothetical protein